MASPTSARPEMAAVAGERSAMRARIRGKRAGPRSSFCEPARPNTLGRCARTLGGHTFLEGMSGPTEIKDRVARPDLLANPVAVVSDNAVNALRLASALTSEGFPCATMVA